MKILPALYCWITYHIYQTIPKVDSSTLLEQLYSYVTIELLLIITAIWLITEIANNRLRILFLLLYVIVGSVSLHLIYYDVNSIISSFEHINKFL